MYAYLWALLPGPKPVKVLLTVLLALAVLLLLMEVVFPWVAAQLRCEGLQVEGHVGVGTQLL